MMRSISLIIGLLAVLSVPAHAAKTETAIFAGGCFWCVEADFDHVPGVTETISGFTGGHVDNPTYRQVSHGGTGHKEAVKVTFDPAVVSYEKLLDAYWHSVDPTDSGGQFCDRGESYQTAIFVNSEEQRRLAEASKAAAEKELGRTVVTPILDAGPFWPAEEYHQNYYRSQDRTLTRFGYVKKADAYKGYREGCGRDARVRAVWGDSAFRGIEKH
jgi:peptide-methionine (S)-S-oxide reductase